MKDDLGNRMKEDYEKRSRCYLTRRTPVIVRVDGKAFHTFCKRFEKPYDAFLNDSLNQVMKNLCSNIQGAKFGERHSDEISILITDFDTIDTDCYFDYAIQKMCSVISSMATAEFCKCLVLGEANRKATFSRPVNSPEELEERTAFQKRFSKVILSDEESWPTFDARCFNLPEHEISNYFWWRMLDAKRNSISMLAQSKFSHKELQGKNSNEMQEMLWQNHDINWNNIYQGQKIGFTCEKKMIDKPIPAGPNAGETVKRNVWEIIESPSSKTELDKRIAGIVLRRAIR
jgi:tRNA(His) guanylyltransferase